MTADTDEWFDIADDADIVIGRKLWTEVHRLKLRHRAVHIFVWRSDGPLLIHLRSDDKEEFSSVWLSSALGHVSAGESYESAARRELAQELGISGTLTRLAKFDACESTSMEFTELYECTWDDAIRMLFNSQERSTV